MPSTSKAQYRYMERLCYDKELAEERGVDQKVAREWNKEDKAKRKEDPEWYDNLPEHAPDRKKKHKKSEESNEGILDSLKKLFGVKPKDNDPGGYKEAAAAREEFNIYKMAGDPHLEDKIELKTGVISIGDIAKQLHLKTWNDNWLSAIEQTVVKYKKEAIPFLIKRNKYTQELEAIYKKTETLKPKEARDYALPAIAAAKRKMGTPPVFTLPLTTLVAKKSGNELNYVFENIGSVPTTIPVPDMTSIKKILTLIEKIDDLDDDDIVYGGWTLDDTDEVKWWDHHFPDEEEIWSEFINELPAAGNYQEYDLGEIDSYIYHLSRQLQLIVIRSIKEVKDPSLK